MLAQHPPWWLVTPAVVAAVVSLLPIGYLAIEATNTKSMVEVWRNDGTVRLAGRSLMMAGIVTLLSTIIGVVCAWLVTLTDIPGRRSLQLMLTMPLAIPSYVAAFVWIETFPEISGFFGAVMVLTLISFPFVFLPTTAAFRSLDPSQAEVARSLGRNQLGVAWRITLRQVGPSIGGGALLVCLYALSDFGAVALMRYEVFTWVVYGAYRSSFDPQRAAVLSLMLVLLALLVVHAEGRARRLAGRSGPRINQLPRHLIQLGAGRPVAVLTMLTVIGLSLIVPIVGILTWLGGRDEKFNGPELADTLLVSVTLAGLAAVCCLILGLPVAIVSARYPSRFSRLLERATFTGHALPGIVVGISLVFVGVRWLRPIYQELPLLLLGYVVLFLPLAVAGARAALESFPTGLAEMARSLGLGPNRVLSRVLIPAVAPSLAASAALVSLTAIKELPVTLLLRPTGMDTLATELWGHMLISDRSAAAPFMALIVFASAIPAVGISRMFGVTR